MTKANVFDSIVAAICIVLTFLFGTWDTALIVLLVFIALDYVTGVMCGIKKKELSSRTGAIGLLKKAMVLIILIVAVMLDRLIGSQWVIRSVVCYFYIANEGVSIIENAAVLGLPVPQKLVNVLKQLKQGDEDKKE